MSEDYRPRINDKVEVYKTEAGGPMPRKDRLVGRVVGIGVNGRAGQCKVRIVFYGIGIVHNWYYFRQVRKG